MSIYFISIKIFFIRIIRSCNNNIIIIKIKRRANELFKIFIKHILLLSFIVVLKKFILFSN